MSKYQYSACLKPIVDTQEPHRFPSKGSPKAYFLDVIVDMLRALPNDAIAPNPHHNIFDILRTQFGPIDGTPWIDPLSRKAAMATALMVTSMFESDEDFQEGADTTAGPETPSEEETGAWQVSANSMALDPSLREFIVSKLGSDHPAAFIAGMKHYPALACEYACRLFMVNTRWSGPTNRLWTLYACTHEAMAEFAGLISA